MNKWLVTLVCSAVGLSAYAEHTPYVSFSAGYASQVSADISDGSIDADIAKFSYGDGFVIEGAIGTKIVGIPVAYELALFYQNNGVDEASAEGNTISFDDDQTALGLMANGYYFIENSSVITPFVMAGFGVAWINSDIGSSTDNVIGEVMLADIDDTVLAGQIGAGLCYAVSEAMCIDLKYKYFFAQDAEINASREGEVLEDVEAEIGSHQLQMGVRYLF